MMAAVMTIPAMEIKRACFWFFPIDKTGGMYDSRRQSNSDQETGEQRHQARRLPGPAIVMHETKQIRHSPHLSHEKVAILQNSPEARLLASAYGCYN